MKPILVIHLLFVFYQSATAQDFGEWMKIVQKTGAASDQVHLQMKLEIYDTLEYEELIHVSAMVMKVSGQKYHYKMDEMEMVKNGPDLVVVDHSLKNISYSQVETDEDKLSGYFKIPDMDSILSFYSNARVLFEDENRIKFRAHQDHAYTNTVDVLINKKTKYLDEFCYNYDEGELGTRGYVRLKYELLDFAPVFSHTEFDKKVFVEVNNGTVKASKRYQDYKLMNVNQ